MRSGGAGGTTIPVHPDTPTLRQRTRTQRGRRNPNSARLVACTRRHPFPNYRTTLTDSSKNPRTDMLLDIRHAPGNPQESADRHAHRDPSKPPRTRVPTCSLRFLKTPRNDMLLKIPRNPSRVRGPASFQRSLETQGSTDRLQCTISSCANHRAISRAADSGPSEAWTRLRPAWKDRVDPRGRRRDRCYGYALGGTQAE